MINSLSIKLNIDVPKEINEHFNDFTTIIFTLLHSPNMMHIYMIIKNHNHNTIYNSNLKSPTYNVHPNYSQKTILSTVTVYPYAIY